LIKSWSKKMDIGVMGWWHQDNQGDFAILESMTRALAPHRVVPIDSGYYINEDVLQRLNLLGFLILGGGGLFQSTPSRPFDTFDLWGSQLQTPIGVAGLGVDVVQPQYRPAVLALVDQARFFYVRDRASQQVVGHPKVQVAPDLSFAYPLNGTSSHLSSRRAPVCGVNLRVTSSLKVDGWVETLQVLPVQLRGIPFTTFPATQEIQTLRQLDEACPTAFDPLLYRGLDLMVGTAFHSVVFSVQAAVPVIAIAYAPKVRRLMTDIGFEDYVLEPDEWHRLPELVERVLEEHSQLVDYLQEVTTALTKSVRQAMADVREEIERAVNPQARAGPRVSIVVVGTASDTANQTTLTSCLNQTYENVEVIFAGVDARVALETASSVPEVKIIPSDPAESLSGRLNRAFAHATGEYLSWAVAGDFYARDTIDCMVNRLQQELACDMVFTDYFTIGERNRIADVHLVHAAHKLFRTNVVGPCFLYHRKLSETIGPFSSDTPLVAYDYWLRAHRVCHLQPMHVPLFYEQVSNRAANDRQRERRVRQQQRSTNPWPLRFFWRIIDTDWAENLIIRPLLTGLRKARLLLCHLRSVRP